MIANTDPYQKDQTDTKLSYLLAELHDLNDQLNINGTVPISSTLINVNPTNLDYKISAVRESSKLITTELNDLDLKIRLYQSSTTDGSYMWKLDSLEKRVDDAIMGVTTELYTPPFIIHRNIWLQIPSKSHAQWRPKY